MSQPENCVGEPDAPIESILGYQGARSAAVTGRRSAGEVLQYPEPEAMKRHHRYKDLQLGQLRSFCLAATEGNFAEAAKASGFSRAAVWQQVRALERMLGITLLRRRGRSVELTPEGRVVLDVALPHVNGLDSLKRLVEARRADLPQRLTVVGTPAMLSYVLCQPLQQFSALHPSIQLHLEANCQPQHIARQVERGEADVGVLTFEPDEPSDPGLEYEDLCELPFLLLTAADHPLANQARVRPQDLVPYPIILMAGMNQIRRAQDRVLRQHHLIDRIHVVMENEQTSIVLQYVMAGLGITLWHLTTDAVRAIPGLHGRIFEPRVDPLAVKMVVRKHAHLPEHSNLFRRAVGEFFSARQSTRQS
jgi:DNA-binding transcriptional LysR family regulator